MFDADCLLKLIKAVQNSEEVVSVTARQRVKNYTEGSLSGWTWWLNSLAAQQGYDCESTFLVQLAPFDALGKCLISI